MSLHQTSASHTQFPTLPREFAHNVFWFTSCLDITVRGAPLHNHNSCFLVIGDERTALIDTAVPFGWAALQEELTRVLQGRTLDYIIATHPESPHMGNAGVLLEAFPNAKLAGDLRNYELYLPGYEDRFVNLEPGDRIDLGGRELVMVYAAVHDLPNTLWVFDTRERVLFVSDGYPYTHEHLAHQCGMCSEEIAADLGPESMMVVIEGALAWTRFVPAEATIADLEAVLRQYPPKTIAPAHGGVITNPSILTEVFKAGLRQVSRAKT